MSIDILKNEELQKAYQRGLNTAVDLVKITIGSRGRNVAIRVGDNMFMSNDGLTIIGQVRLDGFEQDAVDILRDVVVSTSESAKGGRTAAAIMTGAIYNEGMRYATVGCDVMSLKSGIERAGKDIGEVLKSMSRPVKSNLDIKKVATISSESEEIGTIVANIVEKIGRNGIITVEESQSTGIESEIVDGIRFNRGYISPVMVTTNKREAEAHDVSILVTDKKISAIKDIQYLWEHIIREGKKYFVIIADDIDGVALDTFLLNRINGAFAVIGIKTAGMVEVDRKALLEDIALVTGATFITGVMKFDDIKILGKAHRVTATVDETTIVANGKKKDIIKRIESLKIIRNTAKPYELKLIDERIARLSKGMAILKVGAPTEKDRKRMKQKVEDAVTEAMAAVEEGSIVGGGASLIKVAYELKDKATGSHEEVLGYNIVLKALESPLSNIALNAGRDDVAVIIDKIRNGKGNIGYNSTKNEIVKDMIADGVMDAVKIVRIGVQNACNGASLLLTMGAAYSVQQKEQSKDN